MKSLERLRWAVRGALTLGVLASLAANVLHAEPTVVGRAIAAWPPVALLVTVELISRVPMHHRWLGVVRWVATSAVAGIAAWVSYWHMVGVAARYGETATSAHLIPISVDGLVVVASVCLVEIGGRIRTVAAGRPALEEGGPAITAGPAPGGVEVVEVVAPAGPVEAPPGADLAPEPDEGGTGATPRGSGRHVLAELVAKLPADDPRSERQLAADLAPVAGLAPSTARRYLGDLRKAVAA